MSCRTRAYVAASPRACNSLNRRSAPVSGGAWKVTRGGAPPGRGGNDRAPFTPPLVPQIGSVHVGGCQPPRRRGGGRGILWRLARLQDLRPDGAIEPARVEEGEPEMLGDAAGEGALAGGGRAVDGDDHGADIMRDRRPARASAR